MGDGASHQINKAIIVDIGTRRRCVISAKFKRLATEIVVPSKRVGVFGAWENTEWKSLATLVAAMQ
ncbi:MAG: hypothetical protein NVS3B20_01620 [Polyangiales bacterium]